ncbi:MAG: glycoside hydrolase family 27 protein [Opitutaceae bacterium]
MLPPLASLTRRLVAPALCIAGCASAALAADTVPTFRTWAATPPMGWNSWDCFATTVTEAQTKEQADFMAAQLKAHGWQYVVVDIQWYEPGAKSHDYRADAVLTMDGYGRLQPATNRFPSAAGDNGFRALSAYVHGLGLQFGVHLMRGIPRQAVERNLPILGTELHAADIADKVHVCPWNPDMYGVDMSKPGAQAYYDSVFALLAAWGVDYVKVDDLSRPYFQNQPEIEAIRRAIDKTGRPMVLSLSPGATDIRAADHVVDHANLWRISDDFWDRWLALREQFGRLAAWNPHRVAGAWPDADMLPLGTLVLGTRGTRFTPDEQFTLMTLWSIARSPLMHGGDLTKTDPFTLSLLTNDEVLAVNQHSADNRPLFDRAGLIAWTAKDPKTGDTYLALFNTRDRVPLVPENARHDSGALRSEAHRESTIDIDVRDGRALYLAADPVGEFDGFVPVLWSQPRWVLADGTEQPLTAQPWTHADAQWDSTKVAKDGDQVRGLAAQAAAVIEYAVPAGAVRFRATVGIEPQYNGPGAVRCLAVVGTEANTATGVGLPIEVDLAAFTGGSPVRIRDLWTHTDLGAHSGKFAPEVPFHGAKLYRLSAPATAGAQH